MLIYHNYKERFALINHTNLIWLLHHRGVVLATNLHIIIYSGFQRYRPIVLVNLTD
jgi:hypothetical protein